MGSLPIFTSSSLLCLALVVILTLVSPSCSTWRCALDNHQNGFRITLKHVDLGGNFTKFECLKRAMKRGRHRLQRLSAKDSQVKSPVYPGSGEFLIKLAIGRFLTLA